MEAARQVVSAAYRRKGRHILSWPTKMAILLRHRLPWVVYRAIDLTIPQERPAASANRLERALR